MISGVESLLWSALPGGTSGRAPTTPARPEKGRSRPPLSPATARDQEKARWAENSTLPHRKSTIPPARRLSRVKLALAAVVEQELLAQAARAGVSPQDLVRVFVAQGLGLAGTREVPARVPSGYLSPEADGSPEVPSRVPQGSLQGPSRDLEGGTIGGVSLGGGKTQERKQRREEPLRSPETESTTSSDPPGLPGIETPEQARKARERELREEIEWRVNVVWEAHLKAWRQFFRDTNGIEPSNPPVLHPTDIAKPIREALRLHDADLLSREARDRWRKESRVRAAGIGIFYDPFCIGKHKDNDATNGGKRYLEHWRPWKRQNGKADPVTRFADLYFEARDLAS